MNIKIDLHIHTHLYPCAGIEMIPINIIRKALEMGDGIIAITDHIFYRETRNGKEWMFDSSEIMGISDLVFLKQVKDILYNSYKEFTGGELI